MTRPYGGRYPRSKAPHASNRNQMTASLKCPHCAKSMTIEPALAGQAVLCPHCQGRLRVPPVICPADSAPIVPATATTRPSEVPATDLPAWSPNSEPRLTFPSSGPTMRSKRQLGKKPAKRSNLRYYLFTAVGVALGLIALVAALLSASSKERAAARARLVGTWELDLDALAAKQKGPRPVGGFRDKTSPGDQLRALGITMSVQFRADGGTVFHSADGEKTERAEGSWKLDGVYNDDEVTVTCRWKGEFGRERLRLKFLKPDRIEVASRNWFNSTKIEMVRASRTSAGK